MSNQFKQISQYYDKLMNGVPYNFWVRYIETLFKEYNIFPTTILDVACGTGVVSNILSNKGYKVSGFDLSEGMIKVAKENFPNIDFTVQNAIDFSYDKKFDVAISLFDSLNYILNPNDLKSAFSNVFKHLSNRGYFIFDINTEYALANNLFAQIDLSPESDPQYIWEPKWDNETKLCTVNMTFIVKDENGDKIKFNETHVQRAYDLNHVSIMLKDVGYDKIDIYNAYRLDKPNKNSDRVFFVCEKKEL